MRRVLLAHGGGGEETRSLVNELFRKHLSNPILDSLEDAAIVNLTAKPVAFSTDSFTVFPPFFRGGDIGKLAVAGTTNDLSVMGARPRFLSAAFIIEEGFPYEDLQKIVLSMQEEAKKTSVLIVTGDTKVLPKGHLNGVLINTAGIGNVVFDGLSAAAVDVGDKIIVSGTVGDHGGCILAARQEMRFELNIESDCESLWGLIEPLLNTGAAIHAMRDPTRGGLAGVLSEWAEQAGVEMEVLEEEVPIQDAVKGICELLGMEATHLACEGRVVIAVRGNDADRVLEELTAHPSGKGAKVIGTVTSRGKGRVVLRSAYNTRRIMEPPSGELLPRIC
jgi:hydrogenase expression/formation protein HypE